MAEYTLIEKSLSELVATFIYIFLLESILANHILPKTKGHKLGYGWVAMGIGLSCFLAVQYFGWNSSAVNPVMTLANFIVGRLTVQEFLAISVAETIGAFLAATLVWIYYFPFFTTGTENPPGKDLSVPPHLLKLKNEIGDGCIDQLPLLKLLGGNTNPTLGDLRKFIKKYGVSAITKDEDVPLIPSSRTNNKNVFSSGSFFTAGSLPGLSKSPKYSDKTLDNAEPDIETPLIPESSKLVSHKINIGSPSPLFSNINERNRKSVSFGNNYYKDVSKSPFDDNTKTMRSPSFSPFTGSGSQRTNSGNFDFNIFKKRLSSDRGLFSVSSMKNIGKATIDAEYTKKRTADQHAKLAVFAVRPVIYNWPRNLLTEIISTFFLISGILYLRQRGEMNDGTDQLLYSNSTYAFYVGILIVVLILCLGGPGIAMNPARDLGPRLAHWILPISGKGSSEWYYAWIPIVGPFIGATAGTYFFLMTELMDRSSIKAQ